MRLDVHLTVHIPELKHLGAQLMASLADLQGHITALADTVHTIAVGLNAIRDEIQVLKDALAAGSLVTQTDLDALDASVQAVETEAGSIVATEGTL